MPTVRRSATVVLLMLATLLVAGPAWADPAGPTHYRAEVTGVSLSGVDAEVHGGDSYLVLHVTEGFGREVLLPGYDGEEVYLRVDPDGRVFENQASATYFQNQERYGAPIPPSAGPDVDPQWVEVSDDGTFAWHDHRIHWMSPTPPQQVDTTADEPQPVYDWEVPLLVDGEEHTITGSLTWYPSPTPVVPWLVVIAALAVGIALATRSVTGAAAVASVAGVLVLTVVLGDRIGLPTGVEAEPAHLPPAVIAVAAPALALLGRRRPTGERLGLAGLGVLTGLIVVLLQGGALARPVVPSILPGAVVRVALAGALGLGVGALVGVVRGLVGELGGATSPGDDADAAAP